MSQKRVTKEQFLQHLRQCVKTAGTQRAFAVKAGVSAQYVSDVLASRREPGPKLVSAAGFSGREIVFTYTT